MGPETREREEKGDFQREEKRQSGKRLVYGEGGIWVLAERNSVILLEETQAVESALRCPSLFLSVPLWLCDLG